MKSGGAAVPLAVVGGGGDQAAQAVGSGVVRQGVTSVTLGTYGVVFAALDDFLVTIVANSSTPDGVEEQGE